MSRLATTDGWRAVDEGELIRAGTEYGIGYKGGVIPHRAHVDFRASRWAWGRRTLYVRVEQQ